MKFFTQARREKEMMAAEDVGGLTMTREGEPAKAKITIEIEGEEPEIINATGGFAVYSREGERLNEIGSGDIEFFMNVAVRCKETIDGMMERGVKRMLDDIMGGGRR
jgi:hypothetical protein